MEVDYVRVYQREEDEPDLPGNPQVTFIVDMQNQNIEQSGVYVSGSDPQLAGPSGLPMSNLGVGNDLWTVTVPIVNGTYNYKFRNGYHEDWDSDGWESSESLEECGYGTWNDRQFTVSDENLVLGPYCFGSCEPCESIVQCENLGDINNDNVINIVDVVNIINIILHSEIIVYMLVVSQNLILKG